MGKLSLFEVSFIDNPECTYRSSDVLNGQIEFCYEKLENLRGIRIELTGITYTHWTQQEGGGENSHTVHYGYTQYHIETIEVLWGMPSSASRDTAKPAPSGHTVIPFSFLLPANLPESFEGGSLGHTRYTVKAVFDRPWKFDHTRSKLFTILGYLDLNQAPSYGITTPLNNESREMGSTRMKCCCCCPLLCNGRLHYDITNVKTGYVPGESVRVWGSIQNHTQGNLENVRIRLIQKVTFYGQRYCKTIHVGQEYSRTSTNRTHSRTAVEIPLPSNIMKIAPNQTVTFGSSANDPSSCIMLIPPLPCSRFDGSPININYFLQLSINGDNCCLSVKPNISSIVMGTIPLLTAPLYPPFFPPPVITTPPMSYNLPPPSYEESVFGAEVITFSENENAKDKKASKTPQSSEIYQFTPRYVYYAWANPYNQVEPN